MPDETNVAQGSTEATTVAETTAQTTETTATEQTTEQTEQTTADLLADYKPTLPEGVELDQASLDVAMPILKELGLSPEQADKLTGVHMELMQKAGQSILDDINTQCQTGYDTAMAEIKADPVLGKNFEATMGGINAMLTKYGGDGAPKQFQEALTAIAGYSGEGTAAVKALFSTLRGIHGDWADPTTILGSPIKANGAEMYPGLPNQRR